MPHSKNYERWVLMTKYGITPEQRAALLEAQDDRCAICQTAEPGARGWHIDHCHDTYKIRGLLCVKCNAGLGMFNDDSALIEQASRYLEAANTQRGLLPEAAVRVDARHHRLEVLHAR